jgi:hypothetical protein
LGREVNFEQVDPPLAAWAKRHGLHVSTRYKDSEVRSVAIVDDAGCEYQLWLSLLPRDRLEVAAWDFGKRRLRQQCGASQLPEVLESVYRVVEDWVRSDGHTRTPV